MRMVEGIPATAEHKSVIYHFITDGGANLEPF